MQPVRKIIEINEELCDGCGQCVLNCAEGALRIEDGKARLVGEIYCDGLGACLGECPTGALKLVERPAAAFDEKAVEERLVATKAKDKLEIPLACGCPSSTQMVMPAAQKAASAPSDSEAPASSLGHWPIKLQLLSPQAPFLQGADLLLLADCAGAAYPALHQKLLSGKAVALACPKLDDAQAHIDKLAQVLAAARPARIKLVIMEVPCCKGLDFIAKKAMEKAGVIVPLSSLVISRDGQVLTGEV